MLPVAAYSGGAPVIIYTPPSFFPASAFSFSKWFKDCRRLFMLCIVPIYSYTVVIFFFFFLAVSAAYFMPPRMSWLQGICRKPSGHLLYFIFLLFFCFSSLFYLILWFKENKKRLLMFLWWSSVHAPFPKVTTLTFVQQELRIVSHDIVAFVDTLCIYIQLNVNCLLLWLKRKNRGRGVVI